MLTRWQYIAPIFSPIFLAIFPDFFTIFDDFWRYLPIFRDICRFYGNICRYFRMCCDFLYFSYFKIFLYFLFCQYIDDVLPRFSPIIPIISFWTLGDIFADTIFVTLASTLEPSEELLNGKGKLEINFRPCVPDNMEH